MISKQLFYCGILEILLFIALGCSSLKKDWEETENKNTLQAYQEFLQKYPSSEFTERAQEKIETFDWQNATTTNTTEAYENFLTRHSKGALAESSKAKIDVFTWQKTQKLGTITAYENFIKENPYNRFEEKAKLNIDVLQTLVKKLSSSFTYEGSRIWVEYSSSNDFLRLTYSSKEWRIDTTNMDLFKHGEVWVVGSPNRQIKHGGLLISGKGTISLKETI